MLEMPVFMIHNCMLTRWADSHFGTRINIVSGFGSAHNRAAYLMSFILLRWKILSLPKVTAQIVRKSLDPGKLEPHLNHSWVVTGIVTRPRCPILHCPSFLWNLLGFCHQRVHTDFELFVLPLQMGTSVIFLLSSKTILTHGTEKLYNQPCVILWKNLTFARHSGDQNRN